MNIKRIVPDIYSSKMEESKKFYHDFLSLDLAMDMGWIMTFSSSSNPLAQIIILKKEQVDRSNNEFMISMEVEDVDEAYQKAKSLDIKIIYPITNEDWGVRRFFVEDPNGVTINILAHIK